ncbi:hypothetical protein AVEN_255333-1 [Araneus ventricosus]|uniref:Uncharacterized protein n=1 Tax=Araneus ventricosus TaxID=182803 RepID=A0A4Y2GYM0_ARAVE|nr:hypothetical protein AVEN_255333-1 [Araneus ventricosus]
MRIVHYTCDKPLPLLYQKVTVCCRFMAAFIVGPFFFGEIGPSGPVTCTVKRTRYESILRNQLIPALQQRGCVDSSIFTQDSAPQHIATPVKQLSLFHNSLALTCDFWLWGYLNDVLCGDPIPNLAELKNHLEQHIRYITTETLRSVVEHTVLRFQLIGENGGQHIEYFFSKSKPTSFSWWFHQFLHFLRFFGLGTIKNKFRFCFFDGFCLEAIKNRFFLLSAVAPSCRGG